MTNSPATVIKPRPAIADPALSRPDWTAVARKPEATLRLDKNENTDPEFRELVASVFREVSADAAMDYPEIAPVYRQLAEHVGLDARNLLIAAGSDGAIRAVFETFISPGDTVVHTSPTFAMYPVYTAMFGARAAPVAYECRNGVPTLLADTLCAHIRAARPRLVCLPNADSPTGTEFSLEEIRDIVTAARDVGAVILIDEAYYPFSTVTAMPLIDGFENLIVTRTFAKAWGLAGARIGYLAAQPALAEMLHKVRPMYEVNGVALAMLVAMIPLADRVERSVARIKEGKVAFARRMRALDLQVFECAGNFLHVDFGDARDAVHAALHGRVLYRENFSEPCLAGFSRFTGAPAEVMDELSDMISTALAK
ncbi:MAG: histidinol-phosphate transaminase [Alphaproteobacteria bacterium]